MFSLVVGFCCGREASGLDSQHIAEAAKEGDGKAKDGDRDSDASVAGTLLGSSDF